MTPTPAPSTPDDEIDLGQLAAALGRRRAWLAAGAGIGLLGAAAVTFITPKVWEAQFQIVLADNQDKSGLSSILAQGGGIASLLAGQVGGIEIPLETEQTVLQSPSVLLPVFEFVKSQLPLEQRRGLRLNGWAKGNVKVKAEKGTSVLNVSYLGPSPALALAAGQRLASTYQNYSGRKRQRTLQSTIAYLQEQIAAYLPRAEASRARAEAFANRYTLTAADAVPASGGGSFNLAEGMAGLLGSISGAVPGNSSNSIKGQQVELLKRILELRFQLTRVRAAGDREAVVYGGVGNPMGNVSLQELDRLIAERRSRFQDNDPTIVTLQRQRRVLIGALNRQLAEDLQNSIALAQTQLSSMERPEGAVEQFQKLSREANRDEEILQKLENALAGQKLELARESQPWELISSPTLLDRPVSPRPELNLALGLLAGLLVGSGAALVVDRRSDQVFASDELHTLLPYPLLAQLQSADDPSLALLAQATLAGAPQVALIPAGSIPYAAAIATTLQSALQRQDPAAQVLLVSGSDLGTASRCQAQLLLTAPGAATRSELRKLRQDLQLQGRPVAGLLLLQPAPSHGS